MVTMGAEMQSDATPLYRRVKDHVLAQIGSGTWAPSDRVPSENDLVRELGVARMTVNRALRELANEGFLVRVKGGGTFVADRRAHGHPLRIRNIADEIAERGHRHEAEVLTLATVRAAPDQAEDFRIPAGSRLYRSVIVHFEEGRPIQLEERLVNPTVAPHYLRQDFTRQTPHEYLIAVAPLAEAEHVVRAVVPDLKTRRLLDMPPGEPCLLIQRRTWTEGEVASTARLHHPGSRYDLSGRFTPQAEVPSNRPDVQTRETA